MKSPFAGNARLGWTLFTIFVFLMAFELCVRPASAVAQGKATASYRKANVALTTDPSPAHKGTNIIKVQLNDSTDRPITGADVTVTFYMPAMPSMGMTAMKTVVKTSDKGEGMYEGKIDLSSGGEWRVTITASEGGRTITTKKLTIKAVSAM